MKSNLAIGLALIAPSYQAYVWPSQYDRTEDLLYLQSGYIKIGQISDRAHCLFHNNGLTENLHQDRSSDVRFWRGCTWYTKGSGVGTNRLPRFCDTRCL